jgi:hypothetical protein
MPYKNKEDERANRRKYLEANKSLIVERKLRYYLANKEKINSKQRDWYARNRDSQLEKKKVYNETHAEQKHRSYLRRAYGVTADEYERLLVTNDYKCEICLIDQRYTKKRHAVDHCHLTGKIRGLLCSNCNIAIGHLGDDKGKIMKAYEYISRKEPVS